MRCRPSLRLRLWCGAALLALLSVTAAAIAIYGLSRSQNLAAEGMAAQRRIEGYAAHSARVNDWMLSWLMARAEAPDPTPVFATLDRLDELAAADMAAARPGQEAELRLRPSLTPGRLRGFFRQLGRALADTPPGTAAGDAAIAFYAAQAPMIAAQQIDYEQGRRDRALTEMAALHTPLSLALIGIAVLTPLVLILLYLLLFRPLFARLSHATLAAESMAQGAAAADVSGHDELGLMFARLRQIGARLDRRRAQLTNDYDRLEGIVTERTAALTAVNTRLAHIDASRRRFFADVGHELRTPLTVIMGEAELGARHADPEVVSGFETVRNRAERLFRRIEDLLRIAQSESGELALEQGPVALERVISLAQADLAPLLRRAGISVTANFPPLIVAGDADWLRQVFAGLLENAAKYAGRGAAVQISAVQTDAQAVIEIADDGPGLPASSDAFARFTHSGTAPGFGVGLALARWVVEASQGSLEVVEASSSDAAPTGLQLRMTLPLWKGV